MHTHTHRHTYIYSLTHIHTHTHMHTCYIKKEFMQSTFINNSPTFTYSVWSLHVPVVSLHPTHQLYDLDREVAIEALDILDEACEGATFLKALVLLQPQLLHLGEKGAALLTRFFSVRRGFTLMSRLGYLEAMLEKWDKVGVASGSMGGFCIMVILQLSKHIGTERYSDN